LIKIRFDRAPGGFGLIEETSFDPAKHERFVERTESAKFVQVPAAVPVVIPDPPAAVNSLGAYVEKVDA
jgi:hypothetical protein